MTHYKNIKVAQKVSIAYIDTGCTCSRLSEKNANILCMAIDDNLDINDNVGHGTVFAELLTTQLCLNGDVGFQIIPIKVGNSREIKVENICKGLNIAIGLKPDVLSINLSNLYYNANMAKLIKTISEEGTICLSPAGNLVYGITTFPACYHNVIGTTSCNESGQISSGANFYKYIDLAISDQIESLCSFRSSFALPIPPDLFLGTSLTLPIATALAAHLKSVNKQINIHGFRKFLQINLPKIEAPGKDMNNIPFLRRDDYERLFKYGYRFKYDEYSNNFNMEQFFLQIQRDDIEIIFDIYDLDGNRRLDISSNAQLDLYPFSRKFDPGNSSSLLEKSLIFIDGQATWKLQKVEEENYILRVRFDNNNFVDSYFAIINNLR